MNYEKEYKEALERARQVHATNVDENKKSTEYIFPVLKESEDERIRKEIIEHCKNQAKPYIDTGNECPQIQSWIAWLEKQKKSNWSAEDEHIANDTIYFLQDARKYYASIVELDSCIDWLEILKLKIKD